MSELSIFSATTLKKSSFEYEIIVANVCKAVHCQHCGPCATSCHRLLTNRGVTEQESQGRPTGGRRRQTYVRFLKPLSVSLLLYLLFTPSFEIQSSITLHRLSCSLDAEKAPRDHIHTDINTQARFACVLENTCAHIQMSTYTHLRNFPSTRFHFCRLFSLRCSIGSNLASLRGKSFDASEHFRRFGKQFGFMTRNIASVKILNTACPEDGYALKKNAIL